MFKLSCLVYPAVALLSLAAAMTAHAQEITPDDSASQVWVHTETRAEVKAEANVARRSGYTDAMHGEDSGAFYLAHQPTVRDASRVLAGMPARSAQ